MTSCKRIKTLFPVFLICCTLIISTQSVYAENGAINTLGLLVGGSGLGDQSFNDMTYAGLIRAKQEFDLKLIYEDSQNSDEAYEQSMKRLISKGAHIIVANGFYFRDLVQKYAHLYPSLHFIIHDSDLTTLPNVVSIQYAVHEGSFLAGALAAMMTKTKQIGFIGGVDIPIMHSFGKGFEEGAYYINPEVKFIESFVSIGPDFSGFKDPAKGYLLARNMYEEGADILYAAAGLTGNGVIMAARDSGKFAIGVDSDQDHLARGNVLTSMMKRLDNATFYEVKKLLSGKSKAGIQRYGLKESGVGLTPMHFTKDLIPTGVLEKLNIIKKAIIDGSLKIPDYAKIIVKTVPKAKS